MAEVNDKGEVTVAEQHVGRLEGFRFSQDKSATPEEAKMLRQAAMTALKPEFHLRADRFYNAPDTEIDFTEQGGLMWGEHAVGKLVKGGEALRPKVEAFVEEDAGREVIDKVTRRLQHFIDRKVATLFEPLLGMSRDEALTGLSRGFAFQLSEAFGVLPRDGVAADVKALDQEARGQLRKHGVRFGQYTVFLPLLLKPAPTRLRLVLWSLWNDLDVFPEAPPPGLVTVPVPEGTPQEHAAMSGYRIAGSRAIRIDMLERLADQLRSEDSRAGFEAKPDMLSITGMTLEQFADLMQGLGYRAEKGERVKIKAPKPEPAPESAAAADAAAGEGEVSPDDAAAVNPEDAGAEMTAAETADAPAAAETAANGEAADAVATAEIAPEVAETAPEAAAPEAAEPEIATPEVATPETFGAEAATAESEVSQETPCDTAEPEAPEAEATDAGIAEAAASTDGSADSAEPEQEVFYTFTWAPRRQGGGRPRRDHGNHNRGEERQGGQPRGKGGHKNGKGGKRPPRHEGKGGGKQQGPKTYQARPPRKEKAIDPDNPFAAALMGLTEKK